MGTLQGLKSGCKKNIQDSLRVRYYSITVSKLTGLGVGGVGFSKLGFPSRVLLTVVVVAAEEVVVVVVVAAVVVVTPSSWEPTCERQDAIEGLMQWHSQYGD